MLHVIPDGADRFRLLNAAGSEVGWIRGRALRLFGFASDSEVCDAARRAWEALRQVLDRELANACVITRLSPLRHDRDGAVEWLSNDAIPIARMVRQTGGDTCAIELVLPASAPPDITLLAARAIGDALSPALDRIREPMPV